MEKEKRVFLIMVIMVGSLKGWIMDEKVLGWILALSINYRVTWRVFLCVEYLTFHSFVL
jgi:hypothetical protein